MATKIVTKNSSTASAVPTASDLVQGELAVNVADKRLFTENNVGGIVELGTNPTTLNVNGTATMGGVEVSDTDDIRIRLLNGVTFKAGIQVATTAGDMIAGSAVDDLAMRSQTNMLFATGGNAERMRIDSAGNVGIGTSSPLAKLQIKTQANANAAFQNSTSVAGGLKINAFNDAGSASVPFELDGSTLQFNIASVERMRISSAGNVGIGTTSPDTQLTLYKASTNADVNYAKMRMDSWGGSQGKLKSIVWDDAGSAVAGIGAEYDGGKTNIHFHSQYNGGFKGTADRTMSIMGNGNVGIGTSSPVSELDVAGTTPTLTIKDTQNKSWTSADTTLGELAFRTSDTSGIGAHNVSFVRAVNEVASGSTPSGALSFGVAASNANASEAMRIDSSGNVGIGNSSPSTFNQRVNAPHLVVGAGSNAAGLTLYSGTSNQSSINFAVGTTTTQQYDGGITYHPSSYMGFHTNNGAERMRIDSSGNVGMGTSAPDSYRLNLYGAGNGGRQLKVEGTSNNGLMRFSNSEAKDYSIGINGTSFIVYDDTADTYRMIVDTSGNLLVGTTDAAVGVGNTNVGHSIGAAGYAAHSRSGNASLFLNRTTSDGAIANFSKDGTAVGSIGTEGGRLQIGKGASGIYFYDSGPSVLPWNIGSNTGADNSIDLGSSGTRFKNLYLSGAITAGAANTSPVVMTLSTANSNCDITMNSANTSSLTRLRNGTNDFQVHTNGAERMRIDSSGNLLVGKTANNLTSDGIVLRGGGELFVTRANDVATFNRRVTDGDIIRFAKNAVTVGSVSVSGSTTSYNTSSDQRLKENIIDAPSSSNDIDAIRVRSFDWKIDGSHQKYGMVAQELQSVLPEVVKEGKTDEDMMSVDYSKLVPMLIKEIQSLRNRVAQLEE